MIRKILIWSSVAAVISLLVVSVAVAAVPEIRWRAEIIALKLKGELVDLEWQELIPMLMPGSAYYLKDLATTRNPYATIVNPHSSQADLDSGLEIFRSECAICHGLDGRGESGPGLVGQEYRYGDSDWSLFRTITRGIEGTAMGPLDITDRSAWQLVAYVRSLSVEATESMKKKEPGQEILTPTVSSQRLLQAEKEPHNWLTHAGNYKSHRYSELEEINKQNASNLKLKWVYQMEAAFSEKVEATPLVVDEFMFISQPPSDVLALDVATGKRLWAYRRSLPNDIPLCCGMVNRGVAIHGDRVYIGTLDSYLVALDVRSGDVVWQAKVADYAIGYSITAAPLAVNGKIIVGVAGGEHGTRGFLDAYDAETGRRSWRFYTVPAPGQPGHDTWGGDSWKTGGAPTWITGSYDADLNLVYWGVGNPSPNFQGDGRAGDNLYSNSVIALDEHSGELKWHFQFTPHDEHDWDANQTPVLVDAEYQGAQRKLMLWANRNAFYYLLDRETGEFLFARAFAKQTWAKGISPQGRPILRPESVPTAKGTLTYPGVAGATNWWSPSYSRLTQLFYVPVLERAGLFFKGVPDYSPGEFFLGSVPAPVTNTPHWTAVRALAPDTAELQWEYRLPSRTYWAAIGGLLTTKGGLVFGGDDDRFFALDASNGRELWRVNLGAIIHAAPISYQSKGQQRVAIAAGEGIFTFGL